MAKITAKASLVQNSNLFLHIADKGAADITFDDVDSTEFTLTTAALVDWTDTAASDVNGVINHAFAIGDEITLSHMGNSANEGLIGTVTSVTATVLTADKTSAHTMVDEAAGADINVVAARKSYQFVEAGDLSFVDGCQGIVLASKLVDMWDTLDLDKYDKPFTSIEPRAKSLASLNGWEPHDTSTINAIRDTALEIRATATSSAHQIYALWRSGTLDAGTDQFKFWPSSDPELTAPTAAVMTGYINQLFLIYDAAGADNRNSNGGISWFTRCAEEGKTIVMEEHTVDYAEIMPVSAANQVDPKLVETDANVGSLPKYTDIDWTVDAAAYSGDVNASFYDFTGYIQGLSNGSNQTNQTVHEKTNYLWRQPGDINQGTGGALRGDKQWPLTSFSGEVFTVLDGYLLNYNASQRNDLRVTDTGGTIRQWPSVMTISVTSGSLGVGGTFTIWHKDSYGTDGAVVFENESDVAQQDISVASSVDIVMAYSTYTVDGHTGGQPLDIVLSVNRPGYVEPETVEATLSGSNISVSLPNIPDPSYIAA